MAIELSHKSDFERSMSHLQNLMDNEDGLDDILETAFESYQGVPPFETIEPRQSKAELRKLLKILKKDVSPSTILEIGTAEGGSLYTWARYLEGIDTIISIDKEHTPQSKKFFNTFREEEIICLSGRSQDEDIIQKVNKIAGERGLDFILIDGGKKISEIRQDYENYQPLINESGLIAFHDILTHKHLNIEPDILEVWQDVRDDTYSYELMESHRSDKYGYGILEF